MINLILQIREDLLLQLRSIKADPESDVFGILSVLRDMMDFDRDTNWWRDEVVDSNRFVVVDMIVQDEDQLQQLLNLPAANTRINILKALNQDGTEYNEDLYPDQTSSYLGYRNLYDEDGNIVGTENMIFNQHPQWFGWKRN